MSVYRTRSEAKLKPCIGLHEYFDWCEDMGLEAFVDIYSGYSLDGTSITGSALDPYVDDALDELEVC